MFPHNLPEADSCPDTTGVWSDRTMRPDGRKFVTTPQLTQYPALDRGKHEELEKQTAAVGCIVTAHD